VIRRLVETWATLGALVVALLMVSRIPYPHLTKQVFRGRRHFGHLVEVVLLAFIILLAREIALLLLFWGYALVLPVRYVVLRQLRRLGDAAPALDEGLPR
jgi:phosphatidylserine synthase